ncbi:MAG TPA: hypothetical protein VGD80_19150 [Kofleriaceae bacterium]
MYGNVIARAVAQLLALQFAAAVIIRGELHAILVGETPTTPRGSRVLREAR